VAEPVKKPVLPSLKVPVKGELVLLAQRAGANLCTGRHSLIERQKRSISTARDSRRLFSHSIKRKVYILLNTHTMKRRQKGNA
jgi:hypothetical protein